MMANLIRPFWYPCIINGIAKAPLIVFHPDPNPPHPTETHNRNHKLRKRKRKRKQATTSAAGEGVSVFVSQTKLHNKDLSLQAIHEHCLLQHKYLVIPNKSVCVCVFFNLFI